MFDALTKIIPIVLLLLIGFMIHLKKLADENTMSVIKKGIIRVALPAVLFIAFKDMDLKKEYVLVSICIFLMMYVFYLAGVLLNKVLKLNSLVLPFLTTGFAFGLLGIPLFGGVYGLEEVGTLSILGVGHEFFAWFVYLTLVKSKLNNEHFSLKTIRDFIKSPIILAILSGVLINVLGIAHFIEENFLLNGLLLTTQTIAGLTTPLILIVVGYGIRLEKAYVNKAVQIVLVRLFVVLLLGYLIKWVVISRILGGTSPMFDMAYYTFLILPPPFMLAIFVSDYDTHENAAITNNAIVISTVTCVVLFAMGVLITGV